MLTGIDVSVAQNKINWDQVTASKLVDYCFCKVTEGATYVDTYFKINWEAIKQHGFVRGAYEFARTNNPADTEAVHTATQLTDIQPTDMIVLDIEQSTVTGSSFIQWVLLWCSTIESQIGIKPIIYTGAPFWNSHDQVNLDEATIQKLSSYPLWLSAYVNNPTGFIPNEWKKEGLTWTFWQSSGDVGSNVTPILHIPGISGPVDRDEFNGSLDDLKKFAMSLHTGSNAVSQEINETVKDI